MSRGSDSPQIPASQLGAAVAVLIPDEYGGFVRNGLETACLNAEIFLQGGPEALRDALYATRTFSLSEPVEGLLDNEAIAKIQANIDAGVERVVAAFEQAKRALLGSSG